MAHAPLPTTLRRHGRELVAALRDLLLPPHCPGCGEAEPGPGWLCPACAPQLQIRLPGGCARCGEPLGAGVCTADHGGLAGLAFGRAPFRYAGTGGALVRRLKLRGEFGVLRPVGAAMANVLLPDLLGPWRRAVLVPVPLHPRRRRARGFDQAALLAAAVGRRLRLPVVHALARVVATVPQGDPQVLSRANNVAGAFAICRGASVLGRSVVLVDDVVTSGATARACADVLQAIGGACAVALLTACRARR